MVKIFSISEVSEGRVPRRRVHRAGGAPPGPNDPDQMTKMIQWGDAIDPAPSDDAEQGEQMFQHTHY